jgi:hypothetical protein
MLAFLKIVPLWVWVVLAAALSNGVMYLDIRHQAAEIAVYKAAAIEYESAQKTNLATISQLSSANTQWAETYKARVALAQSYINANIQYQNQLQTQLSAARKQLGAVYAKDPNARAWSTQRIPAAVDQQLRAATGSKD